MADHDAKDATEYERGSFTVVQDGVAVASGCGPYEAVKREAAHYAAVYGQDGPVEVRLRRLRPMQGLAR